MVKMLLGIFNMIINVDICYLDILLYRIFIVILLKIMYCNMIKRV